MTDTKKISKVLSEVSIALNGFIKEEADPGLLTGYCGSALFYAYYYRLTGKKKYLQTLNGIIEKALKALEEEELIYSHCSGISGMLWCIQHLMKNGFIEQNEAENIFEEADEALFDYMKRQLSDYYYDFLHEGLGVALYFLDRLPNPVIQQYLEQAAIQIEETCIANDFGISWKDTFSEKSRTLYHSPIYNLGLAHGVPSILSVLSMLYEKGVAVKRTLPLVQKGVQWLLANKNTPSEDCISLYPTYVNDSNEALETKQSRLGWCYGDLGIAIALLNIGNRLQNDTYKQEAFTIFEHSAKNRNKANGGIGDASLCHGSMGVSHIFRRAYMAAGDNVFLEGAENWLEQTLQMARWNDGLAGFKYRTHNGYENNYNLLEGITGIGLALIAALDTETKPAWDRCLLIS